MKKPNGYWNKERCKIEALKYEYKSDFQRNSKAAYLAAYRGKFLDEVCNHMIKKVTVAKIGNRAGPSRNRKNLQGMKFGKWTALSCVGKTKKGNMWICECECGTTSQVSSANLGTGASRKCTKCSNQVSKPSIEIYEYVKNICPDAILSDRGFGFEVDVYIPSKDMAIEYDGLLWHSSKYRNTEKLEKLRYNNFKTFKSVFRIFEDEWKKNKELVLSMIKNRIQTLEPVGNLYSVEISYDTKNFSPFFEKNHLDGYANSLFAVYAKLGDTVVSCALFRNCTQGKHKGELELARFCSDYSINSYGSFSKIISIAKKYAKGLGYSKIISFSDNRISKGAVYLNNGFKLEQTSTKNLNYYYYLHSRGLRVHRWVCQKLYPPAISELDYLNYCTEGAQCLSGIMASIKFGKKEPLYKVWGWGNKLWVLTI